jgi:hypothetical protein
MGLVHNPSAPPVATFSDKAEAFNAALCSEKKRKYVMLVAKIRIWKRIWYLRYIKTSVSGGIRRPNKYLRRLVLIEGESEMNLIDFIEESEMIFINFTKRN